MKFPFRAWPDTSESQPDSDGDPPIGDIVPPLPVIWLIGKTGAGKTSLIHALTGLPTAEIGSGYAPCTRTSALFDFPADPPLMRFLDTRGLGEAGYDAAEDLDQCEGRSHAILVVARADDPVQGQIAEVLADVLRRQPEFEAIVVHTGADLVPDDTDRSRAIATNQARFDKAARRTLPSVTLALTPGQEPGEQIDPLLDLLADTMPEVAMLLARVDVSDAERAGFAEVRPRVIAYASAAGASDVVPLVGAVSVPGIQIAMLRMLGQRSGIDWTRAVMATFLGSLGIGIAARIGAGFGLRQLGKLIPIYGQTLGAAAAGTVSFATTYALGRAAHYYLHHLKAGDTVAREELRAVYRNALKRADRGSG